MVYYSYHIGAKGRKTEMLGLNSSPQLAERSEEINIIIGCYICEVVMRIFYDVFQSVMNAKL